MLLKHDHFAWAMKYILRLAVKTLGEKPILGLESEPAVSRGAVSVKVKQRGRYLVLQAEGFYSELEAESFLGALKRALLSLAVEHNIAFKPSFERRQISFAADPDVAARSLANSFGGASDGPLAPVHGLTEEGGYTIFQADQNIRFLSTEAKATTSTPWQTAESTLTEALMSFLPADDEDDDLSTAIDLYLGHFYESSIRARFLTLIMVLEVLAPVTTKHAIAAQLLSEFASSIDAKLVGTIDPEERDALDALRREIDFRRETSIRRRIRRLVLDEARLDHEGRRVLADEAVKAYDLRSTISHRGTIDSTALTEAHKTALRAVKLILRARLNLTASSKDSN